jgi:hypothetical protein
MIPFQLNFRLKKALQPSIRQFNASSRNITEGRQCIKDVYLSLNKIELYLEKYNTPLNNHLGNHINDSTAIDINNTNNNRVLNYKENSIDGVDLHTYFDRGSIGHSYSLENMVMKIYYYICIHTYIHTYIYTHVYMYTYFGRFNHLSSRGNIAPFSSIVDILIYV